MAELRNERFVVFGEGGSLRRIVVQGAREAGFEPTLAFESTESARIRAMASRGLGVALAPESEAEHEGPPVAVVPVRKPRAHARRHAGLAGAAAPLAGGASVPGARGHGRRKRGAGDVVTATAVSELPIRRNTILLAATMAVYSAVLQLVAAVSSLTFVLVTGVEGLLGLGPAIFLTASALTALPAGRAMDRDRAPAGDRRRLRGWRPRAAR